MDSVNTVNWRKPSRSGGNGGDCVEVADTAGRVLVRDTKARGEGPVLRFTPAAWQRFTGTLR